MSIKIPEDQMFCTYGKHYMAGDRIELALQQDKLKKLQAQKKNGSTQAIESEIILCEQQIAMFKLRISQIWGKDTQLKIKAAKFKLKVTTARYEAEIKAATKTKTTEIQDHIFYRWETANK